jgi:hypothetical protein
MAPPEELRDWLAWWRAGDAYHRPVTFEHAWRMSLARVCRDRSDGEWWVRTLDEQREVWRRAFDREEPTTMEAEFAQLIDDLGLAAIRERRCGFCGASLEGRRANVRFCSLEHRKAAWWEKASNGGAADGSKSRAGALV